VFRLKVKERLKVFRLKVKNCQVKRVKLFPFAFRLLPSAFSLFLPSAFSLSLPSAFFPYNFVI
jgi:hypothetical protein